MAIEYPDDFDTFIEPTLPEETSLSSAGTGDRNHTEHHHDLGDAVEAIERNAALKGHDHSGDGTIAHGNKLDQANTHQNADTDTAPGSIHHSIDPLGVNPNQSAAANHTHDYPGPTILRKPFEICTSMDRPTPFEGKVIWEVDTRRMRVWSQFPGQQQAVQGLYSIDKLERLSSVNLGPTLWSQVYTTASGHGKMATPDGNAASWIPQGPDANRCIARRISTVDAHTQTNDQIITFNTNNAVAEWVNASADNPTTNDAYFRMSDNGLTYVRAALTWWKGSTGAIMLTYTTTGPVGEQLLGQLSATTNTPNILWQLRLVGNKFEAYMGLEYIGAIVDDRTITGFKGWGFGMQAGDGGAEQDLPNEISEVGIADATRFTSSAIWQLLPVGDMPKVGLGVSRAQPINPTGTMIEWDLVEEDNFGYWHAEDTTNVVVTEPGVYHIHASINWGTNTIGDRAASVIMVNNQQTPHMHWEFVRGNNYTPGFSQTVDVTAYLRLAAGDRVGVAAAHNGSAAQYTGYKKGETITQLSRFFMTYHSA